MNQVANKQTTRIAEPRFPIGDVVITANAQATLDLLDVERSLSRHAAGDWGEVSAESREDNELSLEQGHRVMSVFLSGDKRFWIITEADRSVTTVLMPEDY